jgi:hypothetical protein
VRTWGESFVQRLYNDVEGAAPLIDNLLPQTHGTRYYTQMRGFTGKTADMAKLLKFNAFETSARQKKQLGGGDGTPPAWNPEEGRALGHRLFADALDDADEYRALVLADTKDRKELDTLAADTALTPDDEVQALCDDIAILSARPDAKPRQGCGAKLGAVLSALDPGRRVIASHVNKLIAKSTPDLRLFVYGHTHEADWGTVKAKGRSIEFLNTGAFQRLVGHDAFLELAKERKLTPPEALSKLPLEDLAPCYAVALVHYEDGLPVGEMVNWRKGENAEAGAFLDRCDKACSYVSPRNCD